MYGSGAATAYSGNQLTTVIIITCAKYVTKESCKGWRFLHGLGDHILHCSLLILFASSDLFVIFCVTQVLKLTLR